MLADRVGLQMPEQGVDDSMSRLRRACWKSTANPPAFSTARF